MSYEHRHPEPAERNRPPMIELIRLSPSSSDRQVHTTPDDRWLIYCTGDGDWCVIDARDEIDTNWLPTLDAARQWIAYVFPRCADCGVELLPDTPPGSRDWQRYMVHDQVWADAGIDTHSGWLCVPCLEARLGRPLTGQDLIADLPVNCPDRDDDTPRLGQRKTGHAESPLHQMPLMLTSRSVK
jgi:hypothetical protein